MTWSKWRNLPWVSHQDLREFFNERAGIAEFDAGMTREQAEEKALLETGRYFRMRFVDTKIYFANCEQWDGVSTTVLNGAVEVIPDTRQEDCGRVKVKGRSMALLRKGAWVVAWSPGNIAVFSDGAFHRRFRAATPEEQAA